MKKNIFIIVALMCLFGFTCNDDNIIVIDMNDYLVKDTTNKFLVETSWKLLGFFDVEKNELTEVGPNIDAYTLIFASEIQLHGRGLPNLLAGFYKCNYSLSSFDTIDFRSMTSAMPSEDEILYVEAMNKIKLFLFTEDELKLFYNDKKNYLLFNRRTE